MARKQRRSRTERRSGTKACQKPGYEQKHHEPFGKKNLRGPSVKRKAIRKGLG